MDVTLAHSQHTPMSYAPPDLVAEANHRIANSLTLLVSMVRMQAGRGEKGRDSPQQRRSAPAAGRRGGAHQHHQPASPHPVAQPAREGAVSLKPHLQEVTHALVAALSSPEQSVRVVHTGGDCIVLMRQVQPIILILCEVFINAMKHAHPAGVPLVMTVDCTPAADGRLVLTISDDGVGLPEGFDPRRRRHGLQGHAQPGGGNRRRTADRFHRSRPQLPPVPAGQRHGRRQTGLIAPRAC